MSNNSGGKGSKRIPSQVPAQKFADNWELAFGKKKPDETKDKDKK